MKKIGVIALALSLLILPLTVSVRARGLTDPGDCPSLSRVILKLIKVDLTRAQKRSIARILLKNQPEFRANMAQVHLARLALTEALLAPKPDQGAVKAAYGRLSAAGEKLALMAARVLPRLRAVLTPRQVKVLEGVRLDVKKRVKCRVIARRAVVDRWLTVHAK
jgi:Spy/CpxP family protein refolding chaperone